MKSLLKFILIILISVSIVQLYSCKKKTSELDTEKPYLSIVEPMANDTTSMAIEPEIHVEFTATDNDQLKSLSVTLKDGLNNILFLSNPTVDGLKSYSFHQHYLPTMTITGTTLFKVNIIATDQNNNTNTQDILFYLKP
jgi:hypothetical protein